MKNKKKTLLIGGIDSLRIVQANLVQPNKYEQNQKNIWYFNIQTFQTLKWDLTVVNKIWNVARPVNNSIKMKENAKVEKHCFLAQEW